MAAGESGAEGEAGGDPDAAALAGGVAAPDQGRPPGPEAKPGPGADAPASAAGEELAVVHPRLWQRRVAVLRDSGRRRLRWVVAGVVVVGALLVALLALHTPLLAVRHTTVQGAVHSGTEAVLQAAGLTSDPPLIDVDPHTTAADIERLPWVAKAVVVRHWPDSVKITVTERVPVGAFARSGGGVAVVDATGRVLAWQVAPAGGPTLMGPTPPGRPGTTVARADRPAVTVVGELPAAVAARLTAVTVDGAGTVTLDLGGRVRALLGDTASLHQKLVSLASVLAGTRVSGAVVIDVTVPDQPTVGPPGPTSTGP